MILELKPVARLVDAYPLSPMQQGMLYHWLRDPRAGVDLEQIVCTMDAIDVPTFVRAWEQLAHQHTAFRTGFRWRDSDVPQQEIFSDVPVVVHERDLRSNSAADQQSEVAAYLDTDRRAGFDFAVPPLFRLAVFRTAERRYEFVWTFRCPLAQDRNDLLLGELALLHQSSGAED